MKITTVSATMLLATMLSACSHNQSGQAKAETSENPNTKNMKNLIAIVEIPITDYTRAVNFYQTILGITIEEAHMEGTQMGILPADIGAVNVVLVKGNDYKPVTDGAVIYLNAGNDLQPILDKIEKQGGQIIVPKTQISPEMGYFALFIDSEGNKLGLHSSN